MLFIETLLDTKKEIDGKWIIARPEKYTFISRIRDAWQVIKGKADAIKFYKQ